MSEANDNKLPIWFWIVSVVALVWNLLGVMAFAMQLTMSDEARAQLPELERTMYANIPSGYMLAFGIAVFAGALGCIGLLLKKRWAYTLFLLSMVGIVAQQIYMFALSDIGKSMNGGQLGMTLSIPVVGVLLIWFARSSIAKNWLN